MDSQPDLLFGRLAVKGRYLTQGQVHELVRQQTEAAKAGVPMTLGELCQMKRLLTSEQVQVILLAQEFYELRQEDRRLGQLAVMNEFVSQENVDLALQAQKEEFAQEKKLPRRLGRILIEMEVLTDQQLQALLKAQERLAGSGARPAVAEEVEALEDITDRTSSETPHDPAQAVEQPTGYLIQEAGEGSGRTMPLGRKAVIGRQPTNEVPIPDQGSSRQHARIEFIELAKQHVVYDLNSRNGTFVNGKPVTEPVALNPGDRIQIGDSVLRYEAGVGVTPGFISPGSTATTVDAIKMGSQLRNATAEMPAVGAVGQTKRAAGNAHEQAGSARIFREPSPAPAKAARAANAPARSADDEGTCPIPAPTGDDLASHRTCPQCGYELSEKAKFCKGCGSAVAPVSAPRAKVADLVTMTPVEARSAAHDGAIPLAQPACPSCGTGGPVGAAFCASCGASLKAATSSPCPSCGVKIDGVAAACPGCGWTVRPHAKDHDRQEPAAPTPGASVGDSGGPSRSTRVALLLLASCLAIPFLLNAAIEGTSLSTEELAGVSIWALWLVTEILDHQRVLNTNRLLGLLQPIAEKVFPRVRNRDLRVWYMAGALALCILLLSFPIGALQRHRAAEMARQAAQQQADAEQRNAPARRAQQHGLLQAAREATARGDRVTAAEQFMAAGSLGPIEEDVRDIPPDCRSIADFSSVIGVLFQGEGFVDTGRYSSDQQEQIFEQTYKGKLYLVSGEISDIGKSAIIGEKYVTVMVNTSHYVDVFPTKDFNLLDYSKGQQVSFVGTWTELGSGIMLHHKIEKAKRR